ncbi:hypothetical protein Sjap_016307 [Stephania japonica]|uniref:Uncharacterized protein n=1 Tax=Stephania japonica TaxID=461633 RepID=A0AAP0ILP4_9MAGN
MSKYASRGKVLFTKPTAPSLHIEITREREERRAVEGENARRKKRRAAGVKAEEKKRRAEERRAANVRATKRLTIGKSYMNLQEKLYEFAGKVCMHLEEKFNSNIADLARLREIDGQRYLEQWLARWVNREKGIRKTQWTGEVFEHKETEVNLESKEIKRCKGSVIKKMRTGKRFGGTDRPGVWNCVGRPPITAPQ